MKSTDKVLGTISAIDTFLENFPMSLLDSSKSKTYTSIFDFMVDVLVACGVDVNGIVKHLLKKIYGLEAKVDDGIESLYERVKNGSLEGIDQNEFMEGLEDSIKVIFMTLLSGIFTCSAIPVLPNKIFDAPNRDLFKKDKTDKEGKEKEDDDVVLTLLENNAFEPFLVPKKAIDPMGLLDISPTSSDGRLFYDIEGRDTYYKLTSKYVTEIVTDTKQYFKDSGKNESTKFVDVPLFEKQISVYLDEINDGKKSDDKKYVIKLSEAAKKDISVTVNYNLHCGRSVTEWKGVVKAGSTESIDKLSISPMKGNNENKKTIITSLFINNKEGGANIGDKTWIYINSASSSTFTNSFQCESVNWGKENNETEKIKSATTITVGDGELYTEEKAVEVKKFIYEIIEKKDMNDNIYSKAIRKNFVPEDVNEKSPEYIVVYEGLTPNMLYKTNDMNAFLWYAFHKGMKAPQVEMNHMMWDSRVTADKRGNTRRSPADWNKWYQSKTSSTDEFKYNGEIINKNTILYPIIQVAPQGMAENLITVKLPSQRYFRPRIRNSKIDTEVRDKKSSFNSTIYKFNWEYLTNIQILKPKIMLVGMLDELLGLSVSTIKSADFNFTQKLIEAKLSSAMKSVIEANDMEVENCYTEFSNDDVNAMMEEMLLARYNASAYGGETTKVRTHDVQKYIGMLDQVSANASMEGTTTNITKMVTEVTVTPGSEASIDFGFEVNTDGNLLKKLLWAVVKPILMSIFTPQLMLLIYMNFELLGVTKTDAKSFLTQDFGKILNFLMNKIFKLVKSIILFIKDKIVELLLELFYEKIMPLLIKYKLLLVLEYLTYWLAILQAALNCIPLYKFKLPKVMSSIDNVDYADIIAPQETPETSSPC